MIKLEHTVLPSPEQMQFIVEGMRNPMNSWDKSDSVNCLRTPSGKHCSEFCKNFNTDKCDCTLFMRVFRKNILSLDTSLFQSICIYHISICIQEF